MRGSVVLAMALCVGAACAAPPTAPIASPPATSVVPPELRPGGQQPTRPPLAPAVSVSPSPQAANAPLPSPSPATQAAASPTPFHPTLPGINVAASPSPATGR